NVNIQLKSSPATLVAPAVVPKSPFLPRPRRNTLLIGALALVVGCLVIFGIDYVDDRIKSRDDVEAVAGGTATLWYTPRVTLPKGGPSVVSVSTTGPTSGLAEAFRSLRTNVEFLSVEDRIGSILVTS